MIRRWLIVLVILLACSVAAGQDRPHVVIFTSAGCQPCIRLKSDLATSPALAPVSQAAWVNVYDASSPRAAEYRAGRSVPVIIVVEPMVGGRWRECFRQVGYNGDPAALAKTLQVRCQLLRRLICRPRPQPNPGVPPQPDDGTVVPIPEGGGQIPIPDDGPAPDPIDDPITPPVVPPVTPGCTPQPCPADCDCRRDAAELRQEIAAIELRLAKLEVACDPTPPSEGISHLVLVRNKAADYWPRLEAELQTARGHFSAIEEADPPTKFSVALPQLVAYRDGVPVYVAKGIRDVSDALRAIARDEFSVPFSKGAKSGS